ncbi:MAG: cytochrome c oxidase assembly protein, partial [Solirubrobacteraceae bacterium]
PYLYDLTLRNQDVHDLEHLSFLVFGVLFWAQVVDSPPLRCRLAHLQRAAFVLSAMVVGWLLAIVLAFAGAPLYAPYAALATRPGGLSALGDQQLGAGVMWGPGTVPFAIALFALLYRWLDEAHHRPATEIRPPLKGLAGGHT